MDRASLRRPLALSGPMGAGKTTIGRKIADRVGARFADVDEEVAREASRSVAEIFATEGEGAFRARERAITARLLDEGPVVLALGGGSVVDAETRRAVVDRAILVTLEAPIDLLVSRLGRDEIAKRPLLEGGDAAARLRAIVDARRDAYAEAHALVPTHDRPVEEVVDEIVALWRREPVAVPLGARSYRVEVGPGVRSELRCILRRLGGDVLLVTDENAWRATESKMLPALEGVRIAGRVILPSGEVHKTIASVERIWDAALDAGLDRRGVVLAVGGGVVGDLAGFAAATLLRGVRFVQVPTTLLAMVDASVGGKTAVDRPQGKNLVGAFHQPSAVVADTELLATLSPRELRSGLAEVVKTALIGDASLLAALESNPHDLPPLVRASIAHKARVVAADERDVTGARAALNFGHTLGHALEAHGGYERLTHGEAVSLGMIAAMRIGVARGITPPSLLERGRSLLSKLGLPVDLDAEPIAEALPRIASDKKREGAKITFVLLEEVGRVKLEPLSIDEVRAALCA